jgi:predicted MFS family arabinose efflux permease
LKNPSLKAPPFTRQQWLIVLLLASMNFVHILDFVIIMPLGDRLRRELSITPEQFAHVVSAYGLAATVAGVLVSFVVDRFDRKGVLMLSFVAFILATVFCGLSESYVQLLITRAAAGLAGGIVASTLSIMVGDAFANEQRGRAFGILTSAFAVSSIFGLPAGLWLANSYGRGAPFLAIAILCVPILALAIWKLPQFRDHVSKANSPIEQFLKVVERPKHLLCFAFMYCLVLGTFTVIPFLAPYMQANGGLTTNDIPVVYSVAGCATLVSMIVIGQLTDRLGQWPMFLVAALGAIAMTLTITNLGPLTLTIGTLAATGFMVMASGRIVPAQAMMMRTADPALRGAFTNLNSAVSHLATGTAPLISGAIIKEAYPNGPLLHYNTAGCLAAGFGLLAIILSWFLRPKAVPHVQAP